MKTLEEKFLHADGDAVRMLAISFVNERVSKHIRQRNLRLDEDLISNVKADVYSTILEKLDRLMTRDDIRCLTAYLTTMVEREAVDRIDWYLRPSGIGPTARLRNRRIAAGQEPFKPGDHWKRQAFYDERTGERDPPRAYLTREDRAEYWYLVGWLAGAAWEHVGPDPRMRAVLKAIELADGVPILAEIARMAGFREQTLRDRLVRLRERIIASAPIRIQELAEEFLGFSRVKRRGNGMVGSQK